MSGNKELNDHCLEKMFDNSKAAAEEAGSALDVQHLMVTVTNPVKTLLKDISFQVNYGDFFMIVGPNGAGKSTIVKAISGSIPCTGEVLVEGEGLRKLKPRELARRLGVLSQSVNVGYSFTVREVVAMGRYSYAPYFLSRKGDAEAAAVEQALKDTGLTDIADQSVLTLSGGELQRVFLAQLLAQNPHILVLDEPSSHLDLMFQKEIFDLIRTWLREDKNRAVVAVVHDLSIAKRYGNKALLLNQGQTAAYGSMEEVFNQDILEQVYGMDIHAWQKELLSLWD